MMNFVVNTYLISFSLVSMQFSQFTLIMKI